MKKLYLLFSILISIGSNAQIEQLTIDFYPSFINNSQLLFEESHEGYSMTFKYDDTQDKITLPLSAVNDLNSFFLEYKFQHKNSIDTIEVVEAIRDGDTVVQHVISMGTDGITVKGKMKNKDRIQTFEFWSPGKGTKNHELIELLFELMFAYYSTPETINYLEQLEQYFGFGLGLKILNHNPLTYKLYGSISINEAAELYDFFESLPPDQVILIDMSNFNGMGTIFDEDFLDLSESHSKITWVNCSPGAKYALKRAGIKRRRIK